VTRARLGAFALTYRRPQHLLPSLEALLSQTRPPDGILVVANADDPAARRHVEGLNRREVSYESTGANLGSAGGRAYGTRRPDLGYDLVYSGDDDNPPRTAHTVELSSLSSSGATTGSPASARWEHASTGDGVGWSGPETMGCKGTCRRISSGATMRRYRELAGKLGHESQRSPVPHRSRPALWRH
jgi:hypothetical protein